MEVEEQNFVKRLTVNDLMDALVADASIEFFLVDAQKQVAVVAEEDASAKE